MNPQAMADSLIKLQFQNMPGILAIQDYAWLFLKVGVLVAICVELYQLWRHGQCDLFTPLFRLGVASIILGSITEIGDNFDVISRGLEEAMGTETALGIFKDVWARAVTSTSLWDYLKDLGFRSILGLWSMLLYSAMLLIKIWVIDTLQPMRFYLALFMGYFAATFSVFPKMRTLSAWVKQLTQVALWPLIFQFLTALSVGAMRTTLDLVKNLDFGAVLGGLTQGPFGADDSLTSIMKFWCMCGGFIYLTLYTPKIATMIVNHHSVDTLGGMLAAKGTDLFKTLALATMGGPLASVAPQISALTGGFGASDAGSHEEGGHSEGTGQTAHKQKESHDDESSNFDTRRHEPPHVEEGATI